MVLILAIILTIIVNRIYHKMFNVVYFGFSGYFKELFVIFIVSFFLCSALLGK